MDTTRKTQTFEYAARTDLAELPEKYTEPAADTQRLASR